MKPFFFLALSILIVSSSCRKNPEPGLYQTLLNRRVQLPNGWSLTPAGESKPLGDLPLNLVFSPSGKYFAVTNNGQGQQSIMLFDATTRELLSEIPIPKAWLGLKFHPNDSLLYASGGNDNMVRVYQIGTDSQLALADSLVLGKPWPEKISPAGMDIDFAGQRLYTVTKEDQSLYVFDLATGLNIQKVALQAEGYTCLLSPDANTLYISVWGGDQVAIYNTQTQELEASIGTESHPNDLVLSPNGQFLFVANANSNSVSVIDTQQRRVVETIMTALYPNAPTGSTSNALALGPEGKTLYVANADNNCLVVFDVATPGQSSSLGFIPTGWYPTAVKVHDRTLYVANGKGMTSLPNPKGPNPYERRTAETEYIGGLFKGTLSYLPLPDQQTLDIFTRLVYENTPYNKAIEAKAAGEPGNPIPQVPGEPSPIKYVFYVIKENRTYDQVFGDMPEGKGDPSLCLFPEEVSPNHHALAREFVLLDHFFVDAEVSADGHNWSTAAYANDYVEKTWPTNYSSRGGTYDYEGTRKIAYPEKGFIWDYCQRAGATYRSYGEFVWKGETFLPSLVGHVAPKFPGYDLDFRDVDRIALWQQDFDSLLAIGQVPQFSTIRIGNDHTAGARVGKPTPRAYVADNDLALGMLVAHISQSAIWAESAIFVVEDDAQNGPDHIDAHRSIALVISPYVKRRQVNSNFYTTSGFLRTMELILGLPPMSQYDAAATSLYACFTSTPDLTPYQFLPNRVPLDELNKEVNALSRLSDSFDLSKEDAAPDIAFNEVIWKTVKGIHSEMPVPRRSAFVRLLDAHGD